MKTQTKIAIQIILLVIASGLLIFFYFKFNNTLTSNYKLVFFGGLITFSLLGGINIISNIETDYVLRNKPILDPILSFDTIDNKLYVSFIIKNIGEYPALDTLVAYNVGFEKRINSRNQNNIIESGSSIKINLLPLSIKKLYNDTNPFKLQLYYESLIRNKKYRFNYAYKFPFLKPGALTGIENFYSSEIVAEKIDQNQMFKNYKYIEQLENNVGTIVFDFDEERQNKEFIGVVIKSKTKRIFYEPISKEIIFEWDYNDENTLVNICGLEIEEDKTSHRIILTWQRSELSIKSELHVSKSKFNIEEIEIIENSV